jgi:hypothetical protein
MLDRTARPLPLALMIAALLALLAAMRATLDRLTAVSGESILDFEIGYSRARALEVIGAYGREGIDLYQRFLLLDVIVPALYGVVFASLLHLVLAATRFRLFALLPFAPALFDYIEDAALYAIMKSFPDISEWSVFLANIFTITKFVFGALSAIAGAIATIVLVGSRSTLAKITDGQE